MKSSQGSTSAFFGMTAAAVVIAFLLYPATIAGTGSLANGGTMGIASLLVAAALSWRAFTGNRQRPWLRRLVQLPVAAVISFLAIADAVAQFCSGKWLWL